MGLTDSEKQRVMRMLDELDSDDKETVLATAENFCKWLKGVAYSIYKKVADCLSEFWRIITSII